MFEKLKQYQQCIGLLPGWLIAVLAVAGIWALIWKGIALWISARKESKIWFAVLLVVNTVGILEILYIFFFSKKSRPKQNN